jgi:ribonuclease P protein component
VGVLSLPVVAEKGGSVSRPDLTAQFCFPRTDRLTSRRQFTTVYDQGRRVRGSAVTVFGLENQLGHCRVGLTVTRKLGNAVARNRVKRILREIFRVNRLSATGSLDLVVNAHASLPEYDRAVIERDVIRCVSRLTGATQ